MALTDEQREKWNEIFCKERDLIKQHPFFNEGKIDREACLAYLNQLAEAEQLLRVKQQAVVWHLEDSIKDENESEKKRIRDYDKTHRNKSGLEVEREKAEKQKANSNLSKEEKLILSVMARLNCSRDKAVAWIEADI